MGNAKWPGQPAGFPTCQDCHVSANRQPVPYATNTGVEYKSSVGHGGHEGCQGSLHHLPQLHAYGDEAHELGRRREQQLLEVPSEQAHDR